MINAIVAKNLSNINDIGTSNLQIGKTPSEQGVSFEQILSQLSDSMSNNLAKAEDASMQHIAGKNVGMTDVINSVLAAERSLSTAIAIRDKVVQAYTEISRMQL